MLTLFPGVTLIEICWPLEEIMEIFRSLILDIIVSLYINNNFIKKQLLQFNGSQQVNVSYRLLVKTTEFQLGIYQLR